VDADNCTSVSIHAGEGSDVLVEDVISHGADRAVEIHASQLERTRFSRIEHKTGVDSGGITLAGRRVSWAALGAVAAVLAIPTAILIAVLSS